MPTTPPTERELREQICEIGRRMYAKSFAVANEGNITTRLEKDKFLCTPTMHCKGFLSPEDLATIDADGNQIDGEKPRSSEALLHLEIYRARPDAQSVVHTHPPHATAFAITHTSLPRGVLAEAELFLGGVPLVPYETTGAPALAEAVRPFLQQTNVLLLANHGVVSFGQSVERAYWYTEILELCCQKILLAQQLGEPQAIPADKRQELLEIRRRLGEPDPLG